MVTKEGDAERVTRENWVINTNFQMGKIETT